MIKLFKLNELNDVSNYMWSVYQDETKRTIPPYHDLNDVKKHLSKVFARKGDEIIGVYIEGKLEGVALILLEEKNNYLSIQGPYIQESSIYTKVATEIMNYIEGAFRGFKCDFGTTKPNRNAQNFLIEKGFKCTDDSIQMSITPDQLVSMEVKHDIQLLTEDRMVEYSIFHDTQYKDYYWLSDRIYEVMSLWKEHVLLENNKIIGSVFAKAKPGGSGEIYGCEILEPYRNKQVMAELFYISTKSWMEEDVKEIVNFVPEGIMSESASLVGYKGYDTYMCFSKEEL